MNLQKIKDLTKNIKPIDVPATIDRTFRFLEMSFLTALVSVSYSVINEKFSLAITIAMSFAAGIYLAKPLVDWIPEKIKTNYSPFNLILISIFIGLLITASIIPLQTLVKSTFQIDKKMAISDYARLQGRKAMTSCVQKQKSFEECETEAKLSEKNTLSSHTPEP
ncbi:MAG TPA: hypothetical protein EYH41_00710 [Novosphingobium capsulatum]|nr:hypothetical protein [Novosphingobium capsulatum]